MNGGVLRESEGASEPADGTPPRSPITANVARGLSWQALNVVVGQAFWYASLFVLAVIVPPRDFGVIAVATVVVSFTTLLLESGTSGSLIIAPELDPRWVRRSLIRTSIAGVVFTALFAALAVPIANVFAGGADPAVLRVIALTVGMAAVSIVPIALLTKYLRFKTIAQITIIAAATASIAAIVAAAIGWGIWALAVRLVIYQLVITVLSCVASRGLFPRSEVTGGAAAFPRGPATAFLLIAGAGFFAWTSDNLIVGAFTNATQLGLYALAFSLAYAPLTQISWNVGGVLLPAVAAAPDEEAVRRQTLKAVRMMTLVLLPLIPLAAALAPALIPTLLGHRWRGMVAPFQILVLVGVGGGIANVLGETLAGVGGDGVRLRARIDVVWAITTMAAIVVGVNLDGIRGAALGHVVTYSGLVAAYVWLTGRVVGLSPPMLFGAVRQVGGCVIVQAIVTAAVALGISAAGGGTVAAGLGGAFVGALALAAALATLAPDLLREGRGVIRGAIAAT